MRNLLIALVIILGFFFFLTNADKMEAVFETLLQGDWRYILLALFVQFMWLVNIAAQYRSIYRVLGIEERIQRLLHLAIAANFVNVITPSGIVGGATIFVADARKKGYSAARITLSMMLFLVTEYLAFLIVMGLGIIVQFRRNNVSTVELVASGVLLLMTLFLAFLLYMGTKSERALGSLLAKIGRGINKMVRPFIKREYLNIDRAYTFSHEAAEALEHLRENPRELSWPIALGLSNKALMIVIFFMMFLAFKVPFSPGTLIAGYSAGYLFTLISPTPNGIGIVEGVLTLTLRSFFIPLSSAAVVALAYRGFTLWLPLIYGMIAVRTLRQPVGGDHGKIQKT